MDGQRSQSMLGAISVMVQFVADPKYDPITVAIAGLDDSTHDVCKPQ